LKSCLICDDHVMMREALVGSVQLAFPAAALSEAGSFPEAWGAAASDPELILCDLGMPGAPPLEGVRGVMAAAPETPLLVITANEDDALLLALFDLGIAGFLPKTSSSRIIEAAIRLILAGGRYLPARVIDLAIARSPEPLLQSVRAEDIGAAKLTTRQIHVLELMAKGQTNKEIARAFNISPATVKAHAMAAFLALGVSTRAEAVAKSQALGIIVA
jgi:two-component system, NarL family, nitrate/nitrite response regulator NarL